MAFIVPLFLLQDGFNMAFIVPIFPLRDGFHMAFVVILSFLAYESFSLLMKDFISFTDFCLVKSILLTLSSLGSYLLGSFNETS